MFNFLLYDDIVVIEENVLVHKTCTLQVFRGKNECPDICNLFSKGSGEKKYVTHTHS